MTALKSATTHTTTMRLRHFKGRYYDLTASRDLNGYKTNLRTQFSHRMVNIGQRALEFAFLHQTDFWARLSISLVSP